MADELELDFAMGMARRLKNIPGLSWDDDAVVAHAQCLMRWCHGAIDQHAHSVWGAEAQAEWLVMTAIETWDKWQGTAALFKMFKAKFAPAAPAPANVVWAPGEKPPIECRTCSDIGTVGTKGSIRYCDCESGERMASDEDLGQKWLDLLNGRRMKSPKASDSVPFEEQERLFAETQTRKRVQLEAAHATLEDPASTREQKEIAQEVVKLYTYEPPKKKKSRT